MRRIKQRMSALIPTCGIALLSLTLASCILGSGDRPSSNSSDSDDSDGGTSGGNETVREDFPDDLPKNASEDMFDEVMSVTALHSFDFNIILGNAGINDDTITARAIGYSRPRLDEYDDDDEHGHELGSNEIVAKEWDESQRVWADNASVPLAGAGDSRDYYTLNLNSAADDADKGWRRVDDDNAVLYSMVEGQLIEDHLGVAYWWFVDDPIGLGKENIGGHLKQLVFRDIYLSNKNSPTDGSDSVDREEELLGWVKDVDEHDDDFVEGAEKYIIIKYVIDTVYAIEQAGRFQNGEVSFRFEAIDNSITEFEALFEKYAVDSADFAYVDDFDLYVQFDRIAGTARVYDEKDSSAFFTAQLVNAVTTDGEAIGGEDVRVIELNDADKYELGISYDIDLFVAQPDKSTSLFYFGKRYNETDDDFVRKLQPHPIFDIKLEQCLLDFQEVEKREGTTEAQLAANEYFCPKQHIFFNDNAIESIKDHLKSWRDEEYEDEN